MTALATPLQTEYQLTASSLNSSCIVWRCALGHCPVVGGNWLQSSVVHRVWHGAAKWSDSLPYSKYLLPCTISHFTSTKAVPDHHITSTMLDRLRQALLQHLFTCSASHKCFYFLFYLFAQKENTIVYRRYIFHKERENCAGEVRNPWGAYH